MMPTYIVKRVQGEPEYEKLPTFEVTHFRTEVRPVTRGQLFLREGKGFELVMWCEEANPRAIYHNPNDPVHTDSCMEAFVNYYPELPELGYLSVEMNANAASHSSFGTGRHTRSFVVQRDLPHPEVCVEKLEIDGKAVWRARTLIRLELLEALYGRRDFPQGHRMRGNFYKIAAHATPYHAGSWSPIVRPDFHSPDCFGELVIE